MSTTVAVRGVFERTIDALLAIVRQTLYAESSASAAGFLQRRDARAKLVAALALLLASAAAHDARIVAAIFVVVLIAAIASRITRSAVAASLFVPLTLVSMSLAIPALVVTPGNTILALPANLAITDAGLRTAVLLMARVFAAATIGVTLVLTTSWPSLLAALGALRLPAAIVMLFGMTYRYVFLLLRISHDMFVARRSRSAAIATRDARQVLVRTTGVLLAKAIDESERVFLAMTSRGFTGEVRLLTPARLAAADWLLLFTAVAAAIASTVSGRLA